MGTRYPEVRRRHAETMIRSAGYVVCICGRLFYGAEEYVEHGAACSHVQRQAMGRD
jgi:hypothetical protein